jgi:hypothetical protein
LYDNKLILEVQKLQGVNLKGCQKFKMLIYLGLFNGGGHPGVSGRYNLYNGYMGPSSVSTNSDYANYDDDYVGTKHYPNNPK